jgi:hypothetical protein
MSRESTTKDEGNRGGESGKRNRLSQDPSQRCFPQQLTFLAHKLVLKDMVR